MNIRRTRSIEVVVKVEKYSTLPTDTKYTQPALTNWLDYFFLLAPPGGLFYQESGILTL